MTFRFLSDSLGTLGCTLSGLWGWTFRTLPGFRAHRARPPLQVGPMARISENPRNCHNAFAGDCGHSSTLFDICWTFPRHIVHCFCPTQHQFSKTNIGTAWPWARLMLRPTWVSGVLCLLIFEYLLRKWCKSTLNHTKITLAPVESAWVKLN